MPRSRAYSRKRNKRSKNLTLMWLKRKDKTTSEASCGDLGIVESSEDIFNRLLKEDRSNVNIVTNPGKSDYLNTLGISTPGEIEVMDTDEIFDSDGDYELPDLIIEKEPEEVIVTGRRIVNINHILKEMEILASHGRQCTMGRYQLSREIVCGLYSKFIYECKVCKKEYAVTSEQPEKSREVNDAVAWGALSVGIGYSQSAELFSILDIPIMSCKKFKAHEKQVGKVWEETLLAEMKSNAEEEKRIAIEKGDLLNGVPFITVIGDGGWAKRSYGHGLNSASGVGVIIGAATKKLIFLGVRNKYCYVCCKSKAANVIAPVHDCFMNYNGSSTGMESNIIVEGFKRSEDDYGLIYRNYIGDGDSSVFARIQEGCRYGRFVKKVECANHMTRSLSDNLHRLASNTKYPLESRRLLTGVSKGSTITRLERLVKGVRTAIKNAGSSNKVCAQDIINLRSDLKNVPNHVFGNHISCRESFCKKAKDENVMTLLDPIFLGEINKLMERLERKSDTLVFNVTTNCAERYMGLVSKLTGGKRVNFSSGGSYQRRCFGAGLSHMKGPSWHLSPWKTFQGRSPGKVFRKLVSTRENKRVRRSLRYSIEKPKRRKKTTVMHDIEYGPLAIEPDLEDEQRIQKMEEVHKTLTADADRIDEIQNSTIGQHDNALWHEKRMNRLTASTFGCVIKRLDHTPCHNLVKSILFSKDLNTPSVVFGRIHEIDAITAYQKLKGNVVDKCGLFVYKSLPFLAASPDGLVGNDGIVEVKCLPSIEGNIYEHVKHHKNTCLEIDQQDQLKLKSKHNYFYQIQGQLNITGRTWCDFIVFSRSGDIFIERITRNKSLWEKNMLPKLSRFYNECVLPEIVDSRINRQLRVRDPPYIIEAQKKRLQNKTKIDSVNKIK